MTVSTVDRDCGRQGKKNSCLKGTSGSYSLRNQTKSLTSLKSDNGNGIFTCRMTVSMEYEDYDSKEGVRKIIISKE